MAAVKPEYVGDRQSHYTRIRLSSSETLIRIANIGLSFRARSENSGEFSDFEPESILFPDCAREVLDLLRLFLTTNLAVSSFIRAKEEKRLFINTEITGAHAFL
mgnify:CR=1 FL=1